MGSCLVKTHGTGGFVILELVLALVLSVVLVLVLAFGTESSVQENTTCDPRQLWTPTDLERYLNWTFTTSALQTLISTTEASDPIISNRHAAPIAALRVPSHVGHFQETLLPNYPREASVYLGQDTRNLSRASVAEQLGSPSNVPEIQDSQGEPLITSPVPSSIATAQINCSFPNCQITFKLPNDYR